MSIPHTLRHATTRDLSSYALFGAWNALSRPSLPFLRPLAGKTHDYAHYLAPLRGAADIFFPTDFPALAGVASWVCSDALRVDGEGERAIRPARRVSIVPSGEFLQRHTPPAGLAATRTLTGYNPMLQDYNNTQFLVGTVY